MGLQSFTGTSTESRWIAAIFGVAGSGYVGRIILAHDNIINMLGAPWFCSETDARYLAHCNWTHAFDDVLPQVAHIGLSQEICEQMVSQNSQRPFGAPV